MGVKGEDLKRDRVATLLNLGPTTRFVRFKHTALVSTKGTHGLVPLTAERFTPLVYAQFGHGISKTAIGDLRHAVENVAPDWSEYDHYIAFKGRVWDTRTLDWAPHQLDFVYESAIAINEDPAAIAAVRAYLLQLADGDPALAHDYLQAMAPLGMYRKPLGIIWLIGNGANGKSAFLDAWYAVLGDHFAEQSLDMIEDGRSAPALQGKLGNIVREASEKRIEDDKHYKNIGAHETFPIRILGTHETVTVDASFHTVINANNAPVFEDKSDGAIRRTLLVPFPAKFKDDPGFKERLFTPEFLGALVYLTLMETREIREKGYHWSEQTESIQSQYSQNANTAEAFAHHLLDEGVVGFKNYTLLRIHYEAWASDISSNALGRKQFARAVEDVMKVTMRAYRADGVNVKRYIAKTVETDQVVWGEDGLCRQKPRPDRVLQAALGEDWQ